MKNRKGFTLIELLATIAIIGLVLSIGGYFIFKAVESAKIKAFEATKNSVYKSATVYATEFLGDSDWKEVNEDNSTFEKACISIKWLINKGYQKSEDFYTAIEGTFEKYKVYNSDIVILKRNTTSKDIIPEDIYNYNEVNSDSCINILSGEAQTNTTTNSIIVEANCTIKNTIPEDTNYKYCIEGECNNSNDNKYTFTRLNDNKEYQVTWWCESSQGDAGGEVTAKTKELPTPTCTINDNSKTVTVNSNTNYDYVTKSLIVDKENIKIIDGNVNDITSNKILTANKEYKYTDSEQASVKLFYNNINEDATLTVSNSDGTNKKETKCNITKPIKSDDINPPVFSASDGINSNYWHNKNFTLNLIDTNEGNSNVEYYYGTSSSDITTKYEGEISIIDETNVKHYYAKACINNICSNTTIYTVKLDKTVPTIRVTMYDSNSNKINLTESNEVYENPDWLNTSVSLKFEASDSGSGVNSNAVFSYNKSNQVSAGSLIGNKTVTLSNGIVNISISDAGGRYVSLKVCDQAGNCTTKEVKFKTDNTAPTVEVSMNYLNTNVIVPLTVNGNTSSNDTWLNKLVTLNFSASDSLSGLNTSAIFSYNKPYQKEENKDILDESTVTLTNGNFTRSISSYGNRYITLKVCDQAGNCTTKEVKFKIDTEAPIVKYIGKDNDYINLQCESLSGVKKFITTDSNEASSIVYNKNETKHWWGTPSGEKTLWITCVSNAGNYSDYSFKRIKQEENTTYKICDYKKKDLPLLNAIICEDPSFACDGTQKKYTHCTVTNPNGIMGSDGNRYMGYYNEWDWYYYTSTSTSYREVFSFSKSGRET